jgi:hypothetical protein
VETKWKQKSSKKFQTINVVVATRYIKIEADCGSINKNVRPPKKNAK